MAMAARRAARLIVTGFLVMTVLSFGFSQIPPHRCFPPKYVVDSKILSTIVSAETGMTIINTEVLDIAFDMMSYSVAFFMNGTSTTSSGDVQTFYQWLITDYTQKSRWVIDPALKTCTKYRYTAKIQRCIPDSANLTDSYYIGSGDIFADEWTFNFVAEDGAVGLSTLSLLRDVIGVPLRSTFVGTYKNDTMTATTEYRNYQNGISDPDRYFKLPYYCPVNDKNISTSHKKVKSHRFRSIADILL